MKASELVEMIENMIEIHGDLPIYFYAEECSRLEANEVWYIELSKEKEKEYFYPDIQYFMINYVPDR